MVDSQITILGFGWTKSTANSASASKVFNHLNYVDKGGLCKMYVYEQNASRFQTELLCIIHGTFLSPFLLLCSRKYAQDLSLCCPHTFVFWSYKPMQCAEQIPWFSYNLIIEQRGTHIIRNIFPDGRQKALFIVTKSQKTELSKLGWASFCCSHCGFFKCNHRFALYKFINLSGKL